MPNGFGCCCPFPVIAPKTTPQGRAKGRWHIQADAAVFFSRCCAGSCLAPNCFVSAVHIPLKVGEPFPSVSCITQPIEALSYGPGVGG